MQVVTCAIHFQVPDKEPEHLKTEDLLPTRLAADEVTIRLRNLQRELRFLSMRFKVRLAYRGTEKYNLVRLLTCLSIGLPFVCFVSAPKKGAREIGLAFLARDNLKVCLCRARHLAASLLPQKPPVQDDGRRFALPGSLCLIYAVVAHPSCGGCGSLCHCCHRCCVFGWE